MVTGYRLKSSLLQVTPFEKTLFVARILGYLQIQPSFSTYKLGLTSGKTLLRPIAIAMFWMATPQGWSPTSASTVCLSVAPTRWCRWESWLLIDDTFQNGYVYIYILYTHRNGTTRHISDYISTSIYLYRNHDARAHTPTVFNTHTLSISLTYIILTYIHIYNIYNTSLCCSIHIYHLCCFEQHFLGWWISRVQRQVTCFLAAMAEWPPTKGWVWSLSNQRHMAWLWFLNGIQW
jgi:hypothetical protein